MDSLDSIREVFFQECDEQLNELETGLGLIQTGATLADTINAVFRAVHSIKGGAGIFGLDELVNFAHIFETTLDRIRRGELATSPQVIQVFLRAADILSDFVNAARTDGVYNLAKSKTVISELKHLTSTDPALATDERLDEVSAETGLLKLPYWHIIFKPFPSLYAKGNETMLLLRALERLGTLDVKIDVSNVPELQNLDPENTYLSWKIALFADCTEDIIRDVFEFVEGDCELQISWIEGDTKSDGTFEQPDIDMSKFELFTLPQQVEETSAAAAMSTNNADQNLPDQQTSKTDTTQHVNATIRVDLDRVDRMINLVGELVINEAMLSQRVIEAGIARTSSVAIALDELEHLTREIQDSVMAIRAQPVRSVFQRMPRLVREVAAQTNKQVRLLMDGETTEVDKTVIERISDPLTHMIRNAIDHGLESPEIRVAAGKPAEGTVRLVALHRSGRIVVEVSDDGAGINRARVKAKATENGLISSDATLTDEEIDNLIFLPGFSTASAVTDISGRGVGMDVVRRSVQALGGRISIASRPGKGSTFTLSLPLTLAVLDGMVVTAAGHTLIVPLGAILETLQPRERDIHALDHNIRVLAARGGYIPMIDVAMLLGYRHQAIDPTKSVALLVECESGTRAVLLYDTIQGQRQVVIKSLESNYRAVPGIAAATVMGDGRVALILDVDAIITSTRMATARLERPRIEQTLMEVS